MTLNIKILHLVRALLLCIYLLYTTSKEHSSVSKIKIPYDKDGESLTGKILATSESTLRYFTAPSNAIPRHLNEPPAPEEPLHKSVEINNECGQANFETTLTCKQVKSSTDSTASVGDDQTLQESVSIQPVSDKPVSDNVAAPDLPPLDSAAVDELDKHHLLPTFNEYHAMVVEQKQTSTSIEVAGQPQEQPFKLTNSGQLSPPSQLHSASEGHPQDTSTSPIVHPQESSAVYLEGDKAASPSQFILSNDQHPPPPDSQSSISSKAQHHMTADQKLVEQESFAKLAGGILISATDDGDNLPVSDALSTVSTAVHESDELPAPGIPLGNEIVVNGVTNSAVTVPEATVVGDAETATVSSPGHVTQLRRNVAAKACGAKLLDASRAIKSPQAVLNNNNDEYMNVPCSADKWFVVEVCEPVQLRVIELANYELFSSRVKTFNVYVSDRYPSKTWDVVGQFTARDVKGLQTFSTAGDKLIKYVKFEMIEHYGSEHYCPLTMVQLFGLVSDDLADDYDEVEPGQAGGTLRENDGHEVSSYGATADKSDSLDIKGTGREQSLHDEVSGSSASKLQTQDKPASSPPHSTVSRGEGEMPTPAIHRPANSSSSDSDVHEADASYRVTGQPSTAGHYTNDITDVDHNIYSDEDGENVIEKQMSLAKPFPNKAEPGDAFSGEVEASSGFIRNLALSTSSTHSPNHILESTSSEPAPSLGDASRIDDAAIKADAPTGGLNTITDQFSSEAEVNPRNVNDNRGILSSFTESINLFIISPIKKLFNFSPVLDEADRLLVGEYNLSQIILQPHHHTCIISLLAYDLLHLDRSHRDARFQLSFPRPPLTSQAIDGVHLLNDCLWQLDKLYNLSTPDLLTIVGDNKDHLSAVQVCRAAGRILCLPFFEPGSRCVSLIHLFKAFQCYLQTLRTVDTMACSLLSWFLDCGCHRHPYHWHFSRVCPVLPTFLLQPNFVDAVASDRVSASDNTSDRSTMQKQQLKTPTASASPRGAGRRESASPTTTHAPVNGQRVVVVPASQSGARKDAAWMRLSNRVRLLERNVSVSMRYLEELSQSYRWQMERLVRSFNLTAAWLKITAQTAESRNQQQQSRLDALDRRLEELLAEVKLNSGQFNSSPVDISSDNSGTSTANTVKTNDDSTTDPVSLDLSLPPPVPWFPPRALSSVASSSQSSANMASPSHNSWLSGSPEDWLIPIIGDDFDDGDSIVETEDNDLLEYGDGESAAVSQGISATTPISQYPTRYKYQHPPDVFVNIPCDHRYGEGIRDLSPVTYPWWWSWLPWPISSLDLEKGVIQSALHRVKWMAEHVISNSVVGLTLLHLSFAVFSHLLIYYIWLKPVFVRQKEFLFSIHIKQQQLNSVYGWEPDPHQSLSASLVSHSTTTVAHEGPATKVMSSSTPACSGSGISDDCSRPPTTTEFSAATVPTDRVDDNSAWQSNSDSSTTRSTINSDNPSELLLQALSICPVYAAPVREEEVNTVPVGAPTVGVSYTTSPRVPISVSNMIPMTLVDFSEEDFNCCEKSNCHGEKIHCSQSRPSYPSPTDFKQGTSSRPILKSINGPQLMNRHPLMATAVHLAHQQPRHAFLKSGDQVISDYQSNLREDPYGDVQGRTAVNADHHRRRKKWRWKQPK